MKIVKKEQAEIFKNSDTSSLLEYSIALGEKDLDFCINTITGRYPKKYSNTTLCPNEFIPIEEALEIINKCKKYSTIVLSSGIIVDKYILKRIKNFPNDFKYERAPLMECLENDISVKYIDVSEELSKINELCDENNLPFFQHSMPAI